MKIYIASSWRNMDEAIRVATELRFHEMEVDCFCESRPGRYVFHWREIIDELSALDARSFLGHSQAIRAFEEDRKWLNWADGVLMVLPCGNSSHLEAGYVKGQGKWLGIYGELKPGEFDVMYGFADIVTDNLLEAVDSMDKFQLSFVVEREARELKDLKEIAEALGEDSLSGSYMEVKGKPSDERQP
jgi:hypothetical protein